MKEIEKMAEDHVNAQLRDDANPLIRIYSQADYIAGFKAAREMAAESVTMLASAMKDDPRADLVKECGNWIDTLGEREA